MIEKIQEIFRDVFDDDALIVTPETNADDIPEWDSLMHITLMQAVQDEFGVAFTIDEITEMQNIQDMMNCIEGKN